MTDPRELLLRSQTAQQRGVVTWQQLMAAGWTVARVQKALRRDLARVHPRVYVDDTGPLTWERRAWAAVLYAEPAALCWDTATRRPDPDGPIHVAVDHRRRLDRVLNHDSFPGRDRDAERDLDDLADGTQAARLRFGEVFDRPCETAARIARVLQRGGWAGRPTRCGPGCAIR